jgi:hypothetical protein
MGTRNWLNFLAEYSAFFGRYFFHAAPVVKLRAALVRSNAEAMRQVRPSKVFHRCVQGNCCATAVLFLFQMQKTGETGSPV